MVRRGLDPKREKPDPSTKFLKWFVAVVVGGVATGLINYWFDRAKDDGLRAITKADPEPSQQPGATQQQPPLTSAKMTPQMEEMIARMKERRPSFSRPPTTGGATGSGTPMRPEQIIPPTAPFEVDPVVAKGGATVYLADLSPFAYEKGPWDLGMGRSGGDEKGPILVSGKQYPKGISLHPPNSGSCRVSFAPGRQFSRFKGAVGISDSTFHAFGPTIFSVWGDGKRLWESKGIRDKNPLVGFDINVVGVKTLTLDTRMESGGHTGCHAVWLDPWLEK